MEAASLISSSANNSKFSSDLSANTAGFITSTRKLIGTTPMALTKLKKIESTNITALQESRQGFSELVRYENSVFQIRDMDCFYMDRSK